MYLGINRTEATARGFSLVELLVVLTILALLLAIAVPSLISSIPERNLAAAGDRFANDINYTRAKAKASGNNVFLGFEYRSDASQIETPVDVTAAPPIQATPISTATGTAFRVPPNPGVSRIATAYYIVEERPRWQDIGEYDDIGTAGQESIRLPVRKGDRDPNLQLVGIVGTEPYTYLDWLDQYDQWNMGNEDYPVEPLFPFDAVETASAGNLPDPTLGPLNAFAAPLVMLPLDNSDVGDNSSYPPLHISQRPLHGGSWLPGHRLDQARKVFCTADEQEILAYDNFNPGPFRTYDKADGDHARLLDPVVDYVLLKRVELPEHVFFVNPWKDQWVVGWDSNGQEIKNMQFLQYLWQISPSGEMSQAIWTFDPEPFPDGSYTGVVHGTVEVRADVPSVYSMWMVTNETLDIGNVSRGTYDYAGANPAGASVNLLDNRKTNQSMSGRMFTVWSLNGKYYVDDYTPNDSAKAMAHDDPRLNMDIMVNSTVGTVNLTDENVEMEYSSFVAREFGYNQNFLYPAAGQILPN